MDSARLRQILPILYGGLTAILWVTVKGPVAMTVTVVGGILLGLFYALGGACEDEKESAAPDPTTPRT